MMTVPYVLADMKNTALRRIHMAVIVDGDQRLVQSGKLTSTLTGKLKHFLEAAAYYEVEGRFERWNAQDKIDFVTHLTKKG